VDPLADSTAIDLLLWARLHAAGLPIAEDRASLGRALADHLRSQDVLRAAMAGFGPDDGVTWPGNSDMVAAMAGDAPGTGEHGDGDG
jgi:hypothetical protein